MEPESEGGGLSGVDRGLRVGVGGVERGVRELEILEIQVVMRRWRWLCYISDRK